MLSVFDEDKKAIEDLRKTEEEIARTKEGSKEFSILSSRYEFLNKKIAARDSYTYEIRVKTVLASIWDIAVQSVMLRLLTAV